MRNPGKPEGADGAAVGAGVGQRQVVGVLPPADDEFTGGQGRGQGNGTAGGAEEIAAANAAAAAVTM